jgi:phosphoglycolate phosphatase
MSMPAAPRFNLWLFDLDGTLIDSAPDLAAAANAQREKRGLPPLPYEQLRPLVGTGARGMVGAGLGLRPQDDGFEAAKTEFLDLYEANLARHTRAFEHMLPVLAHMEAQKLPWGVVTNKSERFALPLLRHLGLHERACAVVCGDTTPHAKPHPEPLWEAARRVGIAPEQAVYVGDDERDIAAGRAARMGTIAATWGYLGVGEPPQQWGADFLAASGAELLQWMHMP